MIQWIQYIPMKRRYSQRNESKKWYTLSEEIKKIITSLEYKLRNKYIEMIKQVHVVQLMT